MWIMLFLSAVLFLFLSAALCLMLQRRPSAVNTLGSATAVIGGLLAMASAAGALASGQTPDFQIAWSVPFGSFHIALDALSAFFILPIGLIGLAGGLYGRRYLEDRLGRKPVGISWCFYHLLFVGMLLVATAQNGILFLFAWELMSLASFFLVMFDHEQEAVLTAGRTYLVATHLGAAFLLAMFVLLGAAEQTLEFDRFADPATPAMAGAIFILAVLGFGAKAGFLPMHVWLPQAHPAAPSHVSAVMSGVMIKTGIYGLLRVLTFIGPPPPWWGWTLVAVGAVSGIAGVLFALAQHDLKQLLAYHSVENIGIICLGIGMGLLGLSAENYAMATLGFAGGLLHVWNHALFKSLLFFGAGAVAHATGTRNIEQLGGLLKRMPTTGFCFFIGSAAICALPPLNGFVSEFLIYLSALAAVTQAGAATAGLVVIGALSLIGGLAAACFAKAFSTVFLGEPRSDQAALAHESALSMRLAQILPAAMCAAIGLLGPFAVQAALPAVKALMPSAAQAGVELARSRAVHLLWHISQAAVLLAALAAVLHMIRSRLLAKHPVAESATWDCGYAAPNPRMQYSASSFAKPLTRMFRWLLRPQTHLYKPVGLFPVHASLETHTEDVFMRYGYGPLFNGFAWMAGHLRWLQQGRNQLYVLYIAITLIGLLVWKLG